MKILKNILLAVDFSSSSDNLVKNAIDVGKIFESGIILIHVLPRGIKNDKVASLVKSAAESKLKNYHDEIVKEGIEAESLLKYGKHFDEIINTANEKGVNLIMIGAGEKQKKETIKLGTTAEKLVRRSDKPVLVVKQKSDLKNVKRILCPVDFSEESKLALNNAINIARRYNSKLCILSVSEPNNLTYKGLNINWKEIDESNRVELKRKLDNFLNDFNLIDLNWQSIVKTGDPAKIILKTIKKKGTDLLLMGSSGKSSIFRILIGSVTEKVIREVPCTFITLKTENVIKLDLETKIQDIEEHLKNATQLVKDGFYQEAIDEYEHCLKISDMHIPSLKGLSEVYKKLGDSKSSEYYKNIAHEVIVRIWDKKIEADARKFYNL